MNACEVWLRREFLTSRGIEPAEPACDCDPADCPPLPAVSVEAAAETARRLGETPSYEGDH